MHSFSIFSLIIIILLAVYYAFFLSRIINGLNALANQKIPTLDDLKKKISVIVPFRNESENIINCLESLQKQNYDRGNFEVIFVDDFSEDDSLSKLKQNLRSTNIKILSVPEELKSQSSKKTAVNFGIENSLGEIILTTDADCVHHKEWLSEHAKYFGNGIGIVVGSVKFESNNTFFQKFQELEFQSLIITGAGLIGIGKPIICNAANFSFRKELFQQLNGYDTDIKISSGDDVLFMQRVSAETNFKIQFCFDEKCTVTTKSNQNIKEFFLQRKRWAGKIFLYHDKSFVIELFLVFAFYISLIVQIAFGFLVSNLFFLTFIISCLIKVLSEMLVLIKGSKMLNEKFDLSTFLIAEVFHLPYIILSVLGGLFGTYKWKGRKVLN
jgi:poly-beta-1,6-N-acetyl-D-glucosamine synthase